MSDEWAYNAEKSGLALLHPGDFGGTWTEFASPNSFCIKEEVMPYVQIYVKNLL